MILEFEKYFEIWENRKFEKNLKIWKQFGKLGKFGNSEKIWKNFKNQQKIWKFGEKIGNLGKIEKKIENFDKKLDLNLENCT